MIRATAMLMAVVCGAGCSAAPACTPGPEPIPYTSELSELRLPMRTTQPAVIYDAGKYEIHVSPHDLLAVMQGTSPASLPGDALAARLESKLPLYSDVRIRDIQAELAPEAPAPDEKTMRTANYGRFWRQSNERLRYQLTELLESGRAAIVAKSSGAALTTITRNKWSESCFRGRKFLAEDRTVILETDY